MILCLQSWCVSLRVLAHYRRRCFSQIHNWMNVKWNLYQPTAAVSFSGMKMKLFIFSFRVSFRCQEITSIFNDCMRRCSRLSKVGIIHCQPSGKIGKCGKFSSLNFLPPSFSTSALLLLFSALRAPKCRNLLSSNVIAWGMINSTYIGSKMVETCSFYESQWSRCYYY